MVVVTRSMLVIAMSLVASFACAPGGAMGAAIPANGQNTTHHGGLRNATASDASLCRIKGNVSESGERIYHVPGGAFYGRTHVNAARGERWFCTESEARAAGWRRSKR